MPDIVNPYATFARYSADICLFLLVADCGQLSKAAKLAGMSQPRLSQRMKSLEDSLGGPLFTRQRRGVTTTRMGQELVDTLGPHLGKAIEGFHHLRTIGRRRAVIIQTDLAFASFRFLPVLPSLSAACPGVGISLLSTQLPEIVPGSDVDLIVRMERLHPDSPTERLLFSEQVAVVCSPSFKARNTDMQTAVDLLDKPLIDLAARPDAPWFSWSSWFRAIGLSPPDRGERLSFNSYDHVIQSAEEGLGLALGWRGLIDSQIASGRLVYAIDDLAESDLGYFLAIVASRPSPDVLSVFNWVIASMCGR